ncbi:hypothetical protein BH10PLA2_BH10PLA2_00320 [soil metagenome]
MTYVTISLFNSMKAIRSSGDAALNFGSNQSSIELNSLARTIHSVSNMPRYLGFAKYDGQHTQAGLTQVDAVVLEYASTERPALESAIQARGWNALIFNTERPTPIR